MSDEKTISKIAKAGRLLTPSEVAELLHIEIPHLRKLIFTKRIPATRIGRLVRFRPSEIEHWLADQTTPARDNGR